MRARIAVIGLGYVGIPLAVSLARHFEVTGFDLNKQRIEELKNGYDRTNEVTPEQLKAVSLNYTCDPQALGEENIYIVAVPTPVDSHNKPDLTPLKKASETVGKALRKGCIVVFESTVYPGVTEDICGPILEQRSGLRCGVDFYLGYSPERINPGDREHTLERITKVVAGQTPAVAERLARMYGHVNNNNIFVAANIKTAEAAKVIENAQRDINIAFINEIAVIFNRMGISIYDVLEAAQTKWNFLPFKPGLVGGHCIGVDPYYLAECAKQTGQNPEVILAGRRINDHMGVFIAASIHEQLQELLPYGKQGKILVLGLTFKENVPDVRNSKVIDIIHSLERSGHQVIVHDPCADIQKAYDYYGIELVTRVDDLRAFAQQTSSIAVGGGRNHASPDRCFDCIIGAVAHTEYLTHPDDYVSALIRPNGLVADIKGMWRAYQLPEGVRRWEL